MVPRERDPSETPSYSPGLSFTAQPRVLGKAKGRDRPCSVLFTVPTSEGPFILQNSVGSREGTEGLSCSVYQIL